MSTTLSDLTTAVLDAVVATPGLAVVRLASESGPPDATRLPAGLLVLLDAVPGDTVDRLTRVRYELTLWRRDVDPQTNALALAELADAVAGTLLADSSLGGLAAAGSEEPAIQIARVSPGRSAPPMACLAMHIVCHTLGPDAVAQLPPDQQVLINGQPLLASGPHVLTVGQFARRRLDRTFAGLDGVVSIDLGATTRPISVTGRLIADTAIDLADQMAALAAMNSTARPHTITAGDGREFANVRLEQVRWGKVLAVGIGASLAVAYEMQLTQLAE